MSELVDSVGSLVGDLSKKKVLDVGCNDGSLLSLFSSKGADTIGIEPTDAFIDAVNSGHLVLNDYLSIQTVNEIIKKYNQLDVITFTNVFAHIDNLDDVIICLRKLIFDKTLLVIENHYLGSIFERSQFDTFYHEHPRTYSFESFKFIANKLNLEIINVEFPSRYGGNIRIFMGSSKHYESKMSLEKISKIHEREKEFLSSFRNLNLFIEVWKIKMSNKISELYKRNGPIVLKAFPGRAAILVKLLKLDVPVISACYEKDGSKKVNHYIPGTRIPILEDSKFFIHAGNHKSIINLAWHISHEIKGYLKTGGYRGEVIDILSISENET